MRYVQQTIKAVIKAVIRPGDRGNSAGIATFLCPWISETSQPQEWKNVMMSSTTVTEARWNEDNARVVP